MCVSCHQEPNLYFVEDFSPDEIRQECEKKFILIFPTIINLEIKNWVVIWQLIPAVQVVQNLFEDVNHQVCISRYSAVNEKTIVLYTMDLYPHQSLVKSWFIFGVSIKHWQMGFLLVHAIHYY